MSRKQKIKENVNFYFKNLILPLITSVLFFDFFFFLNSGGKFCCPTCWHMDPAGSGV
jgi:hypothetical protein